MAPALPYWLIFFGLCPCHSAERPARLRNQSLVHFLLNLIDRFSLDIQFWAGWGYSFTLLFIGPHKSQSVSLLWEAKCEVAALSAVTLLILRWNNMYGNTSEKHTDKKQAGFYLKCPFYTFCIWVMVFVCITSLLIFAKPIMGAVFKLVYKLINMKIQI